MLAVRAPEVGVTHVGRGNFELQDYTRMIKVNDDRLWRPEGPSNVDSNDTPLAISIDRNGFVGQRERGLHAHFTVSMIDPEDLNPRSVKELHIREVGCEEDSLVSPGTDEDWVR